MRHAVTMTRTHRLGLAVLAAVGLTLSSLGPAAADTIVVGTIDGIGQQPVGVAVTPDGARLYVTDAVGNAVLVVDTATNTITGSPIPVGLEPARVAISPDGTRAYVTNQFGDSVSVIDTAADVVATTIPVGDAPVGVAFTPDGARAYVTGFGAVSAINTVGNTVIATIPLGSALNAVAVTPDGQRAYVADGNAGTVSKIDTATNTVVGAPIPVGNGPSGLAVSPSGQKIYVALSDDDAVAVIDTVTDTVADSIPVGDSPRSVAVTPDGSTAYVTNGNAGTVSVIDTATDTVANPAIPVGELPVGVATAPDSVAAYVTNQLSSSVSVLAPQPSPPRDVTATAGDAEVTASWLPPTDTGGRPITEYIATASPGGKACTTNGATSCTIAGLTNGTAYSVTVTATNGIGATSTSAPSEAVTPTRAVLGISPTTVDFANQTVGTRSDASNLTVTNTGQQPVTIDRVSLSSGDFELTPGACASATLTAGQSCQASVEFTPTSAGSKSATVTVASNADPVRVTLTGIGTAAPTPGPKKKQTLKQKLPKRIKVSGLTLITPANARTNAGQLARTIVRGGPTKPTAAGEVRYFTVVRGPNGKTSVRTYGFPNLKLRVTQRAPATEGFTAFSRTATYTNGKRG